MRTSFLPALTLASLAAIGAEVQAQSCSLVTDINTNGSGTSSNATGDRQTLAGNHFARGFVKMGSFWYFSASTIADGEEIWRTDGSVAGTTKVSNIPGTGNASIFSLVVHDIGAGPRLWFRANNGTNGTELWVSDGTAAGTMMVADINPGSASSTPNYMEKLGNRIIFSANGGTNGTELWITDGTAAGTSELLDIRTGSSSSSPDYMFTDGTTCYFRANDGTNGDELWKTDGTAAGTVLVKDIRTGSGSSSPIYFTKHNGTILFRAGDAAAGTELWTTDGTSAGTVMVKDIRAGTGSSNPNLFYLAVIGTDLFFQASDAANGTELWKTDGTTAGTVLAADVRTGTASGSPNDFYVVGSNLYFDANSGNGTEPFVYNGTTVTSLGDIRPGTSSSFPGNWADLGGGNILFTASNGTSAPGVGTELWVTNGTAAGTMLVKDIRAGTSSSSPSWLTVTGPGTVIMTAFGTEGRELWFSAGTSASTILLKDIEPAMTTGSSSPFWGSSVEARRSINGSTLYMEADDGNVGDELWMLDSNGVATLVKDINTSSATANSDPREFTELFNGTRSLVVFEANDGTSGSEPWVTDGTNAGTVRLADLTTGTGSSFAGDWRRVGEKVFFTATGTGVGNELYVTDGTPAGTMLLKDINSGTSSSNPDYLTEYNGKLVFEAFDSTNGGEVWMSDGTAAGTVLLADIRTGTSSSSPAYFTEVGGKLYFRANDGTNGSELWVTDGTAAGTILVADIRAGSLSSSPFNLTACNGKLFFTANDGTTGTELWVSDGTTAGTIRLTDIGPGTSSSSPGDLTCSGNTLYFDAFASGTTGRELYKSDGTVAGTMLVKDIWSGSSSGSGSYFLAAGDGGIYLTANDGTTGTEVYYSDGTAAGTNVVCDLRPGTTTSNAVYLTYLGNKLVFRATSALAGSEVHQVNVPLAHVQHFGQACGMGGNITSTDPVIGATATVSGDGPAGVPGAALLGFPVPAQGLVLSSPCALHLNLALPFINLGAFTTATWSFNLPIPNDPGLVGGSLNGQAFYVVGTPVLAYSSNGINLTFGN